MSQFQVENWTSDSQVIRENLLYMICSLLLDPKLLGSIATRLNKHHILA